MLGKISENSFKDIDKKEQIFHEIMSMLGVPTMPECNGCTSCCYGQEIYLFTDCGDDPKDYDCHLDKTGHYLLNEVAANNGGKKCTYLGDTGCTIYDKRPSVCRRFDCSQTIIITAAANGSMGIIELFPVFGSNVINQGLKRIDKVGFDLKNMPSRKEMYTKLQKYIKTNNINIDSF